MTGRAEDARRILSELEARGRQSYVTPLAPAIVHIGLRNDDRAFELLEKARDAGDPWLTENNFDLLFDPLRGDARFDRLLERLGTRVR